jgi:hypothetical protein
MFIKINTNSTEYPYSLSKLLMDYPNTSFPEINILYQNDELLKDFNVFRVIDQPIPEYNKTTQAYIEIEPQLINSLWCRQWSIKELSDSEKLEIRRNEEQTVISQRNALLASSDWTQLSDVFIDKEAWAFYRQQLRDISDQPEYPFNLQWPSAPI